MAFSEVAEAFGPIPAPATPVVEPKRVGPAVKPARAAAASGPSVWSRLASWAVARTRTVRADVVGAWAWFCRPPTLAELVAARVPDRDRVPGRNVALWVGWAVYNHLLAAVFALAYPVLFVAAHPARVLLAAVLAVPLFFVWTSGGS